MRPIFHAWSMKSGHLDALSALWIDQTLFLAVGLFTKSPPRSLAQGVERSRSFPTAADIAFDVKLLAS